MDLLQPADNLGTDRLSPYNRAGDCQLSIGTVLSISTLAMFALKKLIASCLMPLSVVLLLLWWGYLGTRTASSSRWAHRVLLVGIISLTLASNKGVGLLLVRSLEARFPAQPSFTHDQPPSSELRSVALILVLGGGHADTPGLSANNQLSTSALARLVEGVRLARALPQAEVWVSGPSILPGYPSHARVLQSAAESLGLAAGRIQRIEDGFDTEGEAAALRRHGHQGPIALVTSAWHMPRAVGLFKKAGISVVPCPADFSARLNAELRITDYLAWDLSGLERTSKAVYEYLGLTWGKLRNKI
ncbi:MAG TPA: YdcF family protein [Opitutaceae bacterium]|nr:YdcF family protein [Opitutaceae bacterium]